MTDSFESQFVDAHNDYRQKHGAPPLTLSSDLCISAQKWADHLLSSKCLEHSSTDHGENLYYASSSVPKEYNGKDAVDSWYSEIKDYHFDKPGFTPGTGHFTQVVWKDSREVGVGIATDGKTIIVVGQYHPAGNISNAGYFEKNVLPPASELDTFVRDLLTSLNQYRSQHGAGRLELSSALTKEAQEWADHLISINRLMNRNKGHGENIFCLSGSSKTAPTGSYVAESWYKEIEKYDFSSPGFKNGAGNFTQMVWKSSKQVGLGLATNGLGKFIAVAFFDPAGNINNTDYFHDNVKTKGSRM
ncbi:repressed by EFG1 protein 1 isoform X2 [Esox lucius]|uniref:repressed by EFG1 protein 1 isoform X2 n=1 Tax=Esox lucius TaxID=8010 RepID=UPI0014773B1E|nr:repressed by EFG1 protein 1 isoform X2 [Esox lucius]